MNKKKKSKPLSELEKRMCPKVLEAAKIENERMSPEIIKEETLDEKERFRWRITPNC